MLTVADVAKDLGVTRQTVLAWIKKGVLKAAQPDRRYLIAEEELQRIKEAPQRERFEQ